MNFFPRLSLAGCLLASCWLLTARGLAQGRAMWLEADTATTAKPGERALHLRAGEGFKPEEERPLQKERISRFDLYADQARRRDLLATGQEGQTPVAKLPPESSACLVVMDRKETPNSADVEGGSRRQAADAGQDTATMPRVRPGQSGADGREVMVRYLKALIPGQDPSSTLPNTFYKRRIEQRLELLLQNNPGRLPPNRRLTVKVLFEGKPLAGAKVFAYRRESMNAGIAAAPPPPTPTPTPPAANMGAGPMSAVTSSQGLAEFKLDQNGAWLVEVVHVRASSERKTNPNGVGESFESTYSFVAKDAPPLPAATPSKPTGSDGK